MQQVTTFRRLLAEYKQLIDADIADYSQKISHSVLQSYGAPSRVPVDAYLEILGRGGKRIRGALVMLGYEMSGGTDRDMILQAARAMEMFHAYILVMDDIQDRSSMRRGGPTAHRSLAEYHKKRHLADDSQHFGIALALNAMVIGSHAATGIMANLPADDERKLMALSIINRTLTITAHGQTNDIMNELSAGTTEEDVERVMEWKTALYTIINPLHVGMVLAGAGCEQTDAITPYATHTGKAFQITDDILGVFGTEFESGKSPLDDIREGKRTLLVVYALEHADKADKNFLIQMLGNKKLTPEEFDRVKTILLDSGAYEYARTKAEKHVQEAIKSLDGAAHLWSADGVHFLREMAQYLLTRTS